MRLGAIARRYLPNVYGITTSPLHGGLPTDRLVAEWQLRSDDAAKVISGADKPWHSKESERETILIPDAIRDAKAKSPDDATQMQGEIREQFQTLFAKGYAATRIEKVESGARYVLEPWK
jgi:predicted GNAT superfamily acetyltransferase